MKLEQRTKPYFQCLLHLHVLFDKGLTEFRHGRKAIYYKLLLRSEAPAKVDANLSAEALRELVEQHADPVEQPPRGRGNGGSDDDGPIGSDCSVGSGDEECPPAGAEPAGAGAGGESEGDAIGSACGRSEESGARSSSSGDASSCAPVGGDDGGDERMVALSLPLVFGGVRFTEAEVFGGRGLVATCAHGVTNCKKRRMIGEEQRAEHGPWEPIAFMLAWSRGGTAAMSQQEHVRAVRPTKA